MMGVILNCLLAAVPLGGVTGDHLTVRAELDGCNVRLGDPMSVSVSFSAPVGFDFKALHPPTLSPFLDDSVWRLDKTPARTETLYIVPQNEETACGRIFTYGIRPVKEGVVSFPELSFTYVSEAEGSEKTITTGPIPVHVKPAAQVVLAETEETIAETPQPDGLFVDLSDSPWHSAEKLSDDDLFAWRKACRAPSAEAFAAFDFPEARLNEAACEILAGNWARAQKIYASLEWRIGQTPTIERGLVAVLALKLEEPTVELPVWRQVLRPVLRFALWGRIAVVVGTLLTLGLLFFLARRTIRAVASLAILLLPFAAAAADPFAGLDPFGQMDRQLQQLHQQMDAAFGPNFINSFSTGGRRMIVNGREMPPIEVKARVQVEEPKHIACETFDVILELEMPKNCTVDGLRFASSQRVGFSIVGNGSALTDGTSTDPSNVVRRLSVPIRYDVPFTGEVSFEVSGQWTTQIRQDNGRGRVWSSQFSQSFRTVTPPIALDISLPEGERPANFSGAVGAGFRLTQVPDRTDVCTNDVVTLSCRLDYRGFLPPDLNLGGRIRADERGRTWVEFKRYFVANGAADTGELSLSYYDAVDKKYKTVSCPGARLAYLPDETSGEQALVSIADGQDGACARVPLRFAPSETAREIGLIDPASAALVVTEQQGPWCRVDDGRRAGWVKKEDLP